MSLIWFFLSFAWLQLGSCQSTTFLPLYRWFSWFFNEKAHMWISFLVQSSQWSTRSKLMNIGTTTVSFNTHNFFRVLEIWSPVLLLYCITYISKYLVPYFGMVHVYSSCRRLCLCCCMKIDAHSRLKQRMGVYLFLDSKYLIEFSHDSSSLVWM